MTRPCAEAARPRTRNKTCGARMRARTLAGIVLRGGGGLLLAHKSPLLHKPQPHNKMLRIRRAVAEMACQGFLWRSLHATRPLAACPRVCAGTCARRDFPPGGRHGAGGEWTCISTVGELATESRRKSRRSSSTTFPGANTRRPRRVRVCERVASQSGFSGDRRLQRSYFSLPAEAFVYVPMRVAGSSFHVPLLDVRPVDRADERGRANEHGSRLTRLDRERVRASLGMRVRASGNDTDASTLVLR